MYALSFHHLSKRYRTVSALDDFTALAHPGRITAFVGANGSGKTTSMRVLLGLTEPSSGVATIGGRRYRDLPKPQRIVGAVLEQSFHPGRTARNHLRLAVRQAGLGDDPTRVDALLELTDLHAAADRKVRGFSLGMRQRLALATALAGDPSVLVLDEPFNGLDPDGVTTMRMFLRRFTDGGGTVLLSSHLLAEVANSADDVIIIGHGHLMTAGPIADLVDADSSLEHLFRSVTHTVRSPS